VPFFDVKQRKASFLARFSGTFPRCLGILFGFSGFCADFLEFCSHFQGFFPDFQQIKTFGGSLNPRLLHHCIKPFRIKYLVKIFLPENFRFIYFVQSNETIGTDFKVHSHYNGWRYNE